MNDQQKIIYGETESGDPPCPECGTDSWNDLGCMKCGLEFWPPSEAYWAATKTTVADRIQEVYADWGLIWVPVSPAPAWGPTAPAPVPVPEALPELPAWASPIEKKFWDAHRRLRLPALDGLLWQYPVSRYKIDFALPDCMTGIELDGHASHSSPTAIAKDRKRQRDLESAGWRIIRFGGQEVHSDADSCVAQAAGMISQVRKG